MKLTKNWFPILALFVIFGGLAGLSLSYGSCTCEDADNWWILMGLFLGACVWLFFQLTSKPKLQSKPKKIKKKMKGGKKKK